MEPLAKVKCTALHLIELMLKNSDAIVRHRLEFNERTQRESIGNRSLDRTMFCLITDGKNCWEDIAMFVLDVKEAIEIALLVVSLLACDITRRMRGGLGGYGHLLESASNAVNLRNQVGV